MKKYFFNFFLWVCLAHNALASLDLAYFAGLDEALRQRGVPSHLLPSQRKSMEQRSYNTKNFGASNTIPREDILPYPSITVGQEYVPCFPHTHLTSLMFHLFPRREQFLLRNQTSDPISDLEPDVVGKLVKVIDIVGSEEPVENLRNIFAKIIGVNLEESILRKIPSKEFAYQDMWVSVHKRMRQVVTERDLAEATDQSAPLTSLMHKKSPRLLDKGYLAPGQLERSTELSYGERGIRLLRQRRFVEVLSNAVLENQGTHYIQEALTSFFWKGVSEIQDMRDFYQGYLGINRLEISDSVFAVPFSEGFYTQKIQEMTSNPSAYFSLSSEERYFLIGKTKESIFTPLPYAVATTTIEDVTNRFPDCVEAGIWSMILHRAFSPKGKDVFDANLLPEGPAKTHIQTHTTWEKVLSQDARDEQAAIVSNKTSLGLEYYQTNQGVSYELKSTPQNVLNTLRYLSGMPTFLGKELSLVEERSHIEAIGKIWSKPSSPVRLEKEGEIIALYLDPSEYAHFSGKLMIYPKHVDYSINAELGVPWMSSVPKAVSSAEQAALVPMLLTPLPDEIMARSMYDNEWFFVEPEISKKAFKFIKDLSVSERLNFYKGIDSREIKTMGFVARFILEHDLENFPYAVELTYNANKLIGQDAHMASRFLGMISPFLGKEHLGEEKYNKMSQRLFSR